MITARDCMKINVSICTCIVFSVISASTCSHGLKSETTSHTFTKTQLIERKHLSLSLCLSIFLIKRPIEYKITHDPSIHVFYLFHQTISESCSKFESNVPHFLMGLGQDSKLFMFLTLKSIPFVTALARWLKPSFWNVVHWNTKNHVSNLLYYARYTDIYCTFEIIFVLGRFIQICYIEIRSNHDSWTILTSRCNYRLQKQNSIVLWTRMLFGETLLIMFYKIGDQFRCSNFTLMTTWTPVKRDCNAKLISVPVTPD